MTISTYKVIGEDNRLSLYIKPKRTMLKYIIKPPKLKDEES